MSGFALVFHRDGSPAGRAVLGSMMAALAHRGPDGADVADFGFAALGHQHSWTTPEEEGERQPLAGPQTPFAVALDGRIDNRPELLAALGRDDADGRARSDAELLRLAFERWGRVASRG